MNVIAEPAVQFGMLQGMGVNGEKMGLGVDFFSAGVFGKLIEQTQAGICVASYSGSAELARSAFFACFRTSSGPFLENPHSALFTLGIRNARMLPGLPAFSPVELNF